MTSYSRLSARFRTACALILSACLVITLTPAIPQAHADTLAAGTPSVTDANSTSESGTDLATPEGGQTPPDSIATQDSWVVKKVGSLSIKKGKTRTLELSNVNESNIIWDSNDSSIATVKTVNNKGRVTGKSPGTTEVVAYCPSLQRAYYVTMKVTSSKVALNKTEVTLVKGKKAKLKLNNAKASKVKWASKKKSVAKVSKKGVVKARKPGTAKIVAKYKGKRYVCKVTVTGKSAKLKALKGTKTIKVKKSKAATIGTLKANGYQVKVPAGAFGKNVKVKVKAKGKDLSIKVVGKKNVRLDKPITIKLALTGKVAETDLDKWAGIYKFNGNDILIDPDRAKLRKGVVQFQIYHLSWFSAKKLTDAELRAKAAYSDALNDISKDYQNEAAGKAIETCFGAALTKVGFQEGSADYDKLMKQLGKSPAFFSLVRAAAEGNQSDFLSKSTEIITDVLVSNADSTKLGYLGAAVGSVPEALDCVKGNDYKGAAEAVSKAVVSNVPYVKMVKFAASVTETTIDYYIDSETDAAYKVYYGLLKNGESGYDLTHGWGWGVIEKQMAAPLRQMNDRAIKLYAEAHGVSVKSLDTATLESIRQMVKNNLIKQFEHRAASQSAIETRQAETEALMKEFEKQGLLKRGDPTVGFGKNDDLELRLTRLLHVRDSIKDMMGGKDYVTLEKTGGYFKSASERAAYNNKKMAMLVSLWVENAWTYGGNAVSGRHAVATYLAETLGLGVSLPSSATVNVGATKALALNGALSSPKWATSNPKIATVTKKGVVKGIKAGTANITAIYGKKTYTCKVTVQKPAPKVLYAISPSNMSFSSTGVGFGVHLCRYTEGDRAHATEVPVGLSDWSATDSLVTYYASPDGGIIVRPRSGVSGTGSVSCVYGGKTYTCTVTVNTTG